jgi:hypothetical protein
MATKTLENLILNFGLIGGIFALSKIFEWLHVWVVVKELQREKKLEKTISSSVFINRLLYLTIFILFPLVIAPLLVVKIFFPQLLFPYIIILLVIFIFGAWGESTDNNKVYYKIGQLLKKSGNMVITCPKCGKDNLYPSNYCSNCGKKLPEKVSFEEIKFKVIPEEKFETITCPFCYQENFITSQYCNGCGKKIGKR